MQITFRELSQKNNIKPVLLPHHAVAYSVSLVVLFSGDENRAKAKGPTYMS